MRSTKKFSIAFTCVLLSYMAEAQSLKRRAPASSDQLAQMYSSSAYDEAYQRSIVTYNSSRPAEARPAVPWDSHRQIVWLLAAQNELEHFAKETALLGEALDELSRQADVQESPDKLASLRQIEDQFTKDCLTDLNGIVRGLDLKTLFRGNKMPDAAAAWEPQPLPRGRNSGKIDLVSDFTRRIVDLMGTTTRTKVVFARTASFNSEPLVDERGKYLKRSDYYIYWRTDTSAVVRASTVKLYGNLKQAETSADRDGLPLVLKH